MAQNATTIKGIDAQSVHRITSGQVVIDLQTAVKELVENSLDAGATTIDVRFKDHGLESIEVVDNGSGISAEDYHAIALKHHTSKLSSFEELTSVTTFGFRGEALSALCALCGSVTVTTATATEAPKGTVLEFDKTGKLSSSSEKIARQRGTTVTINGIFKPLPVRRKELERNVKREFAKALNLLNAYALVPCVKENKGVRLTCTNQVKGKKTVLLRTDGSPSSRSSVSSLWGPKALENVVDLDLQFEVETEKAMLRRQGIRDSDSSHAVDVRMCGLISKFVVGGGRTGTDRQYFFINGRPCAPSKVQKAFNEVYRTYNIGQSPFIVADFIVPTSSLDINVSPDKRTIFIHSEASLINALKVKLEETFAASRATYDLKTQTTPKPPTTPKPLTPQHASSSETPLFLGDDDDDDDADSPTPSQNMGFGEPDLLREEGVDNSQSNDSLDNRHDFVPISVSVSDEADEVLDDRPMSPTATQMMANIPGSPPPQATNDPQPVIPSRRSHSSVQDQPSKRGHSSSHKDRNVQMVLSTQNASWNLKRSTDSEPDQPRKRLKGDRSGSRTGTSSRSGAGKDLLKHLADFARAGSQVTLTQKRNTDTEDEEVDGDEQGCQMKVAHDIGTGDDEAEYEHQMEVDVENNMQEEADGDEAIVHGGHIAATAGRDGPLELIDDDMSVREYMSIIETNQRAGLSDSVLALDDERATSDMSRVASPGLEVIRTAKEDTVSMRLSLESLTSAWQCLGERLTTVRAAPVLVERTSEEQAVLTRDAGLTSTEEDGRANEVLSRVLDKADFLTMEVVGQFNKGFIITRLRKGPWKPDAELDASRGSSVDDLFIVDQHAADEKFNFERLQATTKIEAQKLYQPVPLELTAADELIAIENMDILRQNGFEVAICEDESAELEGRHLSLVSQPISKNTVFDMKDLEELIHLMHDQPRGQMVRCSKARSMFAMRACRTSVMVGTALKAQQMISVVRNMGSMNQPWHCPHGRPTMRHLSDLVGMGWSRDSPEVLGRRFVDFDSLS
ncbi:DNA mismatch repair protein MutL [Cristinia sonorae]|uniref:DNA mismatch repair protein PMS1 n=1 Tax=Cristinia sonorae TaxID=1940300 RepID=A0A8K0UK98_9AGAR|nr:DNA mismatch repair protein MutL [Cristinia sonorae]